jgi:hypothetical protein
VPREGILLHGAGDQPSHAEPDLAVFLGPFLRREPNPTLLFPHLGFSALLQASLVSCDAVEAGEPVAAEVAVERLPALPANAGAKRQTLQLRQPDAGVVKGGDGLARIVVVVVDASAQNAGKRDRKRSRCISL